MASIRTRHIPAENVKVDDCLITPAKTIERVTHSYENGQGWTIATNTASTLTTHRNEIISVVEVSTTHEITAGRIGNYDIVWLDEDWWSVRSIVRNSESARKVDLELMCLNDILETRELTVGLTKKFHILDK